MKTCTTCKHSRRLFIWYQCGSRTNPVTGKRLWVPCIEERENMFGCSTAGLLWERRQPLMERLNTRFMKFLDVKEKYRIDD